MSSLTRKELLRGGASAVAMLGLSSLGGGRSAAAAVAPAGGTGAWPRTTDAGGVPAIDPVIRLYPDKAVQRSGEIRFGPAELSVMLPFMGSGEVVWSVIVPEPGRYRLGLCYSTTREGTSVTIGVNESEVQFAAPLTQGYFYPDPRGPSENPGDPDSDSFWMMREYYLFERIPVPGEVELVRGVNVVRLKVTADKGKETLRLRSLELTPVDQLASVQADVARARASRANTDWFAHAGYGMWFHLLDLTTPRFGPRKPYEEAINAIDVEKMAKTVHDCGASYLIINVNHGNPTCPAPIKSWEELHPGWTTKRDLIAELADALDAHGIKLMLYMNCPGVGKLIQQAGTAIDVPTFSEAEYTRQLIRVFEEFGRRYGDKVVGYWLDSWFQTTEAYPNLPHEALNRAMKTGYPDRLVSMNYWAFPIEVEWQDYWSGEITDLPAKPFRSRYIRRGAGAGLQAHSAVRLDAPWFHIKENTEMEPPRYSAVQLADYIRICQRDQAPVTLGVGIYQDGTIGPKSLAVLKQLRGIIRRSGKRASA